MLKTLRHKLLKFLITWVTKLSKGTNDEEYPASKSILATPVSNADKNPSASEYKLNGPESNPAVVNVINTVILLLV